MVGDLHINTAYVEYPAYVLYPVRIYIDRRYIGALNRKKAGLYMMLPTNEKSHICAPWNAVYHSKLSNTYWRHSGDAQ